MIPEILICAMLLIGSTLMLFASLGLVRFSNALCRTHALAKATTFGICLLLLTLLLVLEDDVSKLKLLLVFGFSLLTIPVASHLVALLIYRQSHRQEEGDEDRKQG